MLNSFFGKVFGGSVIVVISVGLLIYINAFASIESQAQREVELRVAQEAELLGELVRLAWDEERASFQLDFLGGLAQRLMASRLTVLDSRGGVLFDSHELSSSMDNHLERAEIVAPRVPVTRYSDTRAETMVYQACPVVLDGKLMAFARVAISTANRDARIAALRRATRSAVLMASLVALLIAFVIARLISRPLTRISEHVAELGKGPVVRRLDLSGSTEFAQLARAINTMSDEIGRQIAMVQADKAEREAMLSAMTDGLVAVDALGRLLFINGAARKLLDVRVLDPVGIAIWELHRAMPWQQLLSGVGLEAGALGRPRFEEYSLRSEQGEIRLEVTAVGFCAPGRVRTGTVMVLRDVTELRRLEAVRRDFVSNVSHELKTPMTAMRGFLDVVLEDPDLDAEKRTLFLRKAQRNTEQLSAIVSDLLSLSRLESDEHGLRFVSLDVAPLLASVQRESADLAESRHITLRIHAPEWPLFVRADEGALRMALSNLVANAIHYSPEGSAVDIRAAFEACGAARASGQVVIEVQDYGPGIAPLERERIFERFYRVDRARTRGLGGTGLGLAIVRHVMNAHAGVVELESELGQGSTFRLRLSAVEASD